MPDFILVLIVEMQNQDGIIKKSLNQTYIPGIFDVAGDEMEKAKIIFKTIFAFIFKFYNKNLFE